jgi:methylamine dehydrogenase accessory protein MauD
MPAPLVASYVALWLLVLVLLAGFLVMARQIGVLHTRLPSRTARMVNAGPDIGDRFELFEATDLFGRHVKIPPAGTRNTLLVFVSATCGACAAVVTGLKSLRRTERETLNIILVALAGGDADSHRSFAKRHRLPFPFIVGSDLSQKYRIGLTPYAVLLGPDGIVYSKGVVNQVQDIESLLNVADLSTEERRQWALPLSEWSESPIEENRSQQ